MNDSSRPGSDRVSSGNPALDHVLCGGFRANSLNVIMGEPGTGKTVLATQMAFTTPVDERPVVYVGTLSEPTSKMLFFLQDYPFFDQERMGRSVHYESVAEVLQEKGFAGLVDSVRDLLREHSPAVLVIDSFKAARDLASTSQEARRVVYEIAALLGAHATTSFLIGEYSTESLTDLPEFAVADGIVELIHRYDKMRRDRYLRVIKLRGSDHLPGMHSFDITADGIRLWPRLVPPTSRELAAAPRGVRVSTGVAGLDAMLGGGYWQGTSTLVAGPSGVGKTVLGLRFLLEGVEQGEPGLLVGLEENRRQLTSQLQSFGEDVDGLRERGLHIRYSSPPEVNIDRVSHAVLHEVEARGVRRVVIDSITDLNSAADGAEQLYHHLYALVQQLGARGVTTMLTYHESRGSLTGQLHTPAAMSYLTDNLLLLEWELNHRSSRRVRVLKTRSSTHSLNAAEVRVDSGGIEVTE